MKVQCIIPSLCLHTIVNGDKLKTIKDLEQTSSEISKSLDKAKQLKQEIQTLKTYLETQKHEYNFVGLSNGFQKIKKDKEDELKSEHAIYQKLFWGIIIFSILKVVGLVVAYKCLDIKGLELMSLAISTFILLFVLLYFFRISLLNIKSIKSQLLQIDLRLTLCQFISNYGNEIEKMNQTAKESLERFESVIFSPIVPTESQIPATFEGIDQLTNLIGIINKDKT